MGAAPADAANARTAHTDATQRQDLISTPPETALYYSWACGGRVPPDRVTRAAVLIVSGRCGRWSRTGGSCRRLLRRRRFLRCGGCTPRTSDPVRAPGCRVRACTG